MTLFSLELRQLQRTEPGIGHKSIQLFETVQGAQNLDQREGPRRRPALEVADSGPAETGRICERLLGQVSVEPTAPEPTTDLPQDGFVTHAIIVHNVGFRLYYRLITNYCRS